MITIQKTLAIALVSEYYSNGASQRFDALNEAFSHPDRVLRIEGGQCMSGFGWSEGYTYCTNLTDEDKTHCDDCIEAIHADETAATENEAYQSGQFDEYRMLNSQYMAATWPRF